MIICGREWLYEFVKRNVKTNSIKTKELAYKTYVRPKVEYCSVVWDPLAINYHPLKYM
jgi:hypothetical protein